jgi:RNA polymerase primary sigma factor
MSANPLNKLFKIAVLAGVVEAVSFHINRGDDLNARDQNGYTPLMLAASRNRAEICERLIGAGADPTLHDSLGRDALAIAKELKCADSSETLERAMLQTQEEIDELDVESLWEAAEETALPLVDKALFLQASIIQTRISGHLPVDLASEWADVKVVLPTNVSAVSALSDLAYSLEVQHAFYAAYVNSSITSTQFESANQTISKWLGIDSTSALEVLFLELNVVIEDYPMPALMPYDVIHIDAGFREYMSDAVEFLEELLYPEFDSHRVYLKECYAGNLLLSADERELGEAMQISFSHALAVLSEWPEGLLHVIQKLSDPDWFSEYKAEEASENPSDEDAKQITYAGTDLGFNGMSKEALKESLARLPVESITSLVSNESLALSASYSKFSNSIKKYIDARSRLVESNLRLVNHSVKKFMNNGLPLEDLIQEGNMGLIKAAERYDWEKGFKFSTYAVWWIRQSVYRAIANHSRVVRFPTHLNAPLVNVNRELQFLAKFSSSPPSTSLLAERLGYTMEKMNRLLQLAQEVIEWDESDQTGFCEENGDSEPEKVACQVNRVQVIDALLSKMDNRLANILRLRFGFNEEDPLTLEEIGVVHGLTRERVRQLESKALDYLRGRTRSIVLRDLADYPGPMLHN